MSLSKSLLKNCLISRGKASASAGTTDQDTTVYDMSNYESVMVIWLLGDATSGSVVELQVFGNTASSTSSPSPVELTADDATYTAGASDADDKILIVDIPRWNPTYRYMFARGVIDTQNCVSAGFIVIGYNARTVPITQDSTVLDSALLAPLG